MRLHQLRDVAESGVGHAERLKIALKSGGGKQEKARGEDVESRATQYGVSQRRTPEACSCPSSLRKILIQATPIDGYLSTNSKSRI